MDQEASSESSDNDYGYVPFGDLHIDDTDVKEDKTEYYKMDEHLILDVCEVICPA